jgi:hypothetical protein
MSAPLAASHFALSRTNHVAVAPYTGCSSSRILALTPMSRGLFDVDRGTVMLCRNLLGAMVLVVLSIPGVSAEIFDSSKYPDWSGQWRWVPDGDVPRYDHTKPIRQQQAPLKPEYQALFEASIKDQDSGGLVSIPITPASRKPCRG